MNDNATLHYQLNERRNLEANINYNALLDLQSSMLVLQEQANYALINEKVYMKKGKVYSEIFKNTLHDIIMTDISDLNTLVDNIAPILQSNYLNSNEFKNELRSLLPKVTGRDYK